MKYDEFIAKVRKRARLASNEEAERATRATLQTLAERIGHAEAEDLAAQLPDELAMYLRPLYAEDEERFSLSEFFRRVGERERTSAMEADYHSRIVLALLAEVVSIGEINDVRARLPADFARLFAVENEGDVPELGRVAESEK